MAHSDTDEIRNHGQRIVVLETIVGRIDADMKEQTSILSEMRDEMIGVRGAVRIGVALLGIIGTVVGIYVSMKG